MAKIRIKLKRDPTVQRFLDRHGTLCAATTLTTGQYLRYQLGAAGLLALFLYDWKIFMSGLLFACAAFYVLVIGYKFLTILIGIVFRPEIRIHARDLAGLADEEMPVYTVLVPMYKEKAVAEKVMRAVSSLDYPQDKLDVKVLLEEDDRATIAACRALELPACVEIVVVPHARPKTKPKACNHGLDRARGEYLVIYDAEDRPERDQLKKAVLAFRQVPKTVACLQAKLNYYNPHQNLLTQWFTIEYTAWFDLYLPGLHALDVPIPLGGTSNHFRVAVLRDLAGWDPFNLTEDCDLGVRLHRRRWRTLVLDSTTWEEANSQLGNWIRQRSRWVKGYIQTHFVHTRSNLATCADLGPKDFASFLLTVGGLALSLLLNPFFWIMGLAYAVLWSVSAVGLVAPPWELGWQMRYYDRIADLPGAPFTVWSQLSWIFWGAAVVLALANVIFVLVNVLACLRRGLWRLLPQAVLSPLYWMLISVGAWKGLLQLFSRPFYWEKTQHGLAAQDQNAQPALGGE